ncbi:hypothetical protein EXIGLDRAFT_728870 [Exidia glandulosa HHB12029]|uniref:Fe2OG dioxygenase domain-containing protein n=1 Tax=Exidia glandulosa HHB12029 TaxID=1314781 RepID=A0A165CTC5_EXIGL|nr:hypothetical protein EXIGLDRAFT_728870 [Exidia glandulosa HHB12029]
MNPQKRRRNEDEAGTEQNSPKRPKVLSWDASEPLDLEDWRVDNMPGAEVYYVPKFIDSSTCDEWFSELDALPTWYHPTLKVYGKNVRQSRSIAAYASSTKITAKYSGHEVVMHYPPEIPEILSKIWARVSRALGMEFNHVMLNRYASGAEYIGKHRDTKENVVIVSLSLGAERTFIMAPNKTIAAQGAVTKKWTLGNGSLLVMQGSTQDNWKHEIPQERRIKEGRISLTFRQLPE